ncbi:hypothetical protein D3Z52_22890, partial [Clostridiaceae bacterium]|nr:hypothetical protein [Clostridiaceae bacterium]
AACALSIAPLLDFVEFRLHKILHQAEISDTAVRGSFSDKQFKCLLDESFLDKIVCSAFCS